MRNITEISMFIAKLKSLSAIKARPTILIIHIVWQPTCFRIENSAFNISYFLSKSSHRLHSSLVFKLHRFSYLLLSLRSFSKTGFFPMFFLVFHEKLSNKASYNFLFNFQIHFKWFSINNWLSHFAVFKLRSYLINYLVLNNCYRSPWIVEFDHFDLHTLFFQVVCQSLDDKITCVEVLFQCFLVSNLIFELRV